MDGRSNPLLGPLNGDEASSVSRIAQLHLWMASPCPLKSKRLSHQHCSIHGRPFSATKHGFWDRYDHVWGYFIPIPQSVSSDLSVISLTFYPANSSTLRPGDSVESMAWLRQQLVECEKSHKSCRSRSQSSGFPNPVRFIKVDESAPHLVEIQEDTPKFLALSHRWGSAESLKTTKRNIDSHMAEIPTDRLSKTFRDALHLATCLDVPYVWIDSLCIIQDDVPDWLEQSQQMGQIFESAYLTVAAVDAWADSDIDLGLFIARDMVPIRAEITSTLKMSYNRIEKKEDGELAFYHDNEAVDIHTKSDMAWEELTCKIEKRLTPFLMSVENSDWNSRGWVFQERMLSSRIVYFTKEQLFWECREDINAEHTGTSTSVLHTDSNAPPQSTRLHRLMADTSLRLQDQQSQPQPPTPTQSPPSPPLDTWPEHQIFHLWFHLASRYSTCALTRPSDKWWALAGLASSLSTAYASPLHAGIWEAAPGASLLWHVRDRPLGSLERDFIAPSWSWLGLDGPVGFAYRDYSYAKASQRVVPLLGEVGFDVDDVADEYDGERGEYGEDGKGSSSTARYGFVGTVSFSCPTRTARVSGMQFGDFAFSEVTGRHGWDQSAAVFLDGVSRGRSGMELMIEVRAEKNLPAHCRLLMDGGGERAIGWAVLDREDFVPETVVCVAVCLRVLNKGRGSSEREVVEVLALAEDDASEGTFRRVGRGRVVEKGWLKDCVTGRVSIK